MGWYDETATSPTCAIYYYYFCIYSGSSIINNIGASFVSQSKKKKGIFDLINLPHADTLHCWFLQCSRRAKYSMHRYHVSKILLKGVVPSHPPCIEADEHHIHKHESWLQVKFQSVVLFLDSQASYHIVKTLFLSLWIVNSWSIIIPLPVNPNRVCLNWIPYGLHKSWCSFLPNCFSLRLGHC